MKIFSILIILIGLSFVVGLLVIIKLGFIVNMLVKVIFFFCLLESLKGECFKNDLFSLINLMYFVVFLRVLDLLILKFFGLKVIFFLIVFLNN